MHAILKQGLVSMLPMLLTSCVSPFADPPHAWTEWQPFEVRRTHIVLTLTVREKENVEAIFDTGSNATVIDDDLAKELGIWSSGKTEMFSISEKKRVSYARGIPFKLYGAQLKTDVLISDLNHLGVSAIIGADLLRAMVFEIDYPKKRMRFHNNGGYSYKGPTEAIPLLRRDNRYFVSLITDGTAREYLLDTGSAGSLSFMDESVLRDYIARTRAFTSVSEARKAIVPRGTGVLGERVQSLAIPVKNLKFGSYELHGIEAEYIFTENYGGQHDNILGAEALLPFVIIIDAYNQKMYAELPEE